MKRKITLQLILLLVVFTANAQSIITVDNSPSSNAQYNDLNSAISLANSGDIIYIHPSETSYGDISLDKTLTLIGYSHSDSDRETVVGDISLGPNTSNSRFSGLHLTDDFVVDNSGSAVTGIIFENNIVDDSMQFRNAGVDNIIIRGNIIDYIGYTCCNSEYTNAIISNNIINNSIVTKYVQSITIKNNIFLDAGIVNYYPANGNATIQNSIFYANTNATRNINDTNTVFENCISYNMGSGIYTDLNGTDNKNNIDPLFVQDNDNAIFEPTIDDFHFQSGSLAIGAGVSGEDLGLYDGGNFEFDNLGFTNGIPTVKIEAFSNTVAPGQNINVTISTSTH